MKLRDSRNQLLKVACNTRASKNQKLKAIQFHEEVVAETSGLTTELLNKYVPQLEAQVKALEEFVASLNGKYITDQDPKKSTLKSIRENYEKIDINELFNQEVIPQLDEPNPEPGNALKEGGPVPDKKETSDE